MTDDDPSLRLIDVAEDLDEIESAIEQLEIDDALGLASIAAQLSDICLDMSETIDRQSSSRGESFRLEDDDVLTDGGLVNACPVCGNSSIHVRSTRNSSTDTCYACHSCGAEFDDPTERPSRNPSARAAKSGLARELEQMDPDDLRTDGGEDLAEFEELADEPGSLPDDESMRCYCCDRVVHRRHISYTPEMVEIDGGPHYEYVDVPMCERCRLRRYGVSCDYCGEFHWDVEGVFECGRDRGYLGPDGHLLRPDGGRYERRERPSDRTFRLHCEPTDQEFFRELDGPFLEEARDDGSVDVYCGFCGREHVLTVVSP